MIDDAPSALVATSLVAWACAVTRTFPTIKMAAIMPSAGKIHFQFICIALLSRA